MFKFERALEAVTYYLAEFLYDIKLIEVEEKEESKKNGKVYPFSTTSIF